MGYKMNNLRFDYLKINAKKTDEGYLVDTPIVGRVGIQIYRNADGSMRREFRPPEEVFDEESLASFAGKPITDDHPEDMVTAENAKKLAVGMIKDAGKRVNNDVVAPIIVLDAQTIKKIENGKKELSLGYTVEIVEQPGEWNGQKYDAIQKNIRINHLAVVVKGRAGNARFNLDGLQSVDFFEEQTLKKVKLDNGIEYDAAPEVAVELDKLRLDAQKLFEKNVDLQKYCDGITAERDLLKSQIDQAGKIREDALNKAKEELKARADLENIAARFDVDCSAKSDKDIKISIIKSLHKNIDFTNRSDEYIQAAFDLVLDSAESIGIQNQRKIVNDGQPENKSKNINTYADFMSGLKNLRKE